MLIVAEQLTIHSENIAFLPILCNIIRSKYFSNMVRFLKLIGVLLVLVLILGTGQILVYQGGRPFLWQLFWLGLVIWLWGYIILIKLKDKEKEEGDQPVIKDALLLEQKNQLDQLKTAAVSALVAITFFYSSISWIFKDDVLLSGIVLIITFLVSFSIQNAIFQKKREDD